MNRVSASDTAICSEVPKLNGAPSGTSGSAPSGEPTAPLRSPRRWFSFLGAGSMVAVGYMDPGNWATDLAGGAQFGYSLLSVVLLASLAAMLLQWIAARVGLVTGKDLAQLCRDNFGRKTTFCLWIASEIAIIACDVAEVVGSAVALQLLLGVSLAVGVILSAIGTVALLMLRGLGKRAIEIAITTLILFVALSLIAQIALAKPVWHELFAGFVPTTALVRHAGMLWLAAGIMGATIMPHNLYLHSALVKHHIRNADRAESAHHVKGAKGADRVDRTEGTTQVLDSHAHNQDQYGEIATALRGVTADTVGALSFAFLINAALLVVAAAVFHAAGQTQLDDLADAHRLLSPLVGNSWAAPLFASALLACGLNSTVTGTLAGQIVMEGFTTLRMSPWRRVLLTRSLALGPALIAVAFYGEGGSNRLLVASQVVLSMQLPLAIIPLMLFAQRRSLMGIWQVRGITQWACWAVTAGIVGLNGALIFQSVV